MARFTENEIKVIKQFNLNSDVKIVFTKRRRKAPRFSYGDIRRHS